MKIKNTYFNAAIVLGLTAFGTAFKASATYCQCTFWYTKNGVESYGGVSAPCPAGANAYICAGQTNANSKGITPTAACIAASGSYSVGAAGVATIPGATNADISCALVN